ncbi:MAG: hypothetical protein WKG00_17710 [Polyangiaceae bacterium]
MSVHSNVTRVARGPLFAASLVAVLALALAGCGYSAADYCQDFCDCNGCNDNELDDCIDNAEDSYDDAVDEGCEDQADEYLSCLGDEAVCRDGNRFDADGCEDEAVDVAKCVN